MPARVANQTVKCEACGAEIDPVAPPMSPQVANGLNVCVAVMINLHAVCPKCGAKYVSQIQGVQFALSWVRIQEQSRIVVPSMIPPRLM